MRTLLRWIWRIITFGLILGLTYATTFQVLPFLDSRLPVFPVVLILYGLIAYILLPLIIRFWRIVFIPDHIPRYVLTGDGWPSEPVNIAIIAKSRRQLVRHMKVAGWYEAEPMTIRGWFKEFGAILFDTAYPTAPLSNLYLFGRKQDIGFEIPHGESLSPRRRHHVRFWQLTNQERFKAKDSDAHFSYWFERIKHLLRRKRSVWIGAATNEPYTIDFRWRDFQLTHGNDGDPDGERDYIISTLQAQGLVRSIKDIRDGEPFTMRAQNIGTNFIVDGYIKVIDLKTVSLSKKAKKSN